MQGGCLALFQETDHCKIYDSGGESQSNISRCAIRRKQRNNTPQTHLVPCNLSTVFLLDKFARAGGALHRCLSRFASLLARLGGRPGAIAGQPEASAAILMLVKSSTRALRRRASSASRRRLKDDRSAADTVQVAAAIDSPENFIVFGLI